MTHARALGKTLSSTGRPGSSPDGNEGERASRVSGEGSWPTGVGGKSNAGVAAQVKSTTGAIGYNELAYVLSNNMQYAAVQNANRKYVLPSVQSAAAAAQTMSTFPEDLRFYFVDAPGDASYPITGFSWVIVYQHQTNVEKGKATANMLWWVTHDGQQYATALSYVPLPPSIVTKDEVKIKIGRAHV